MYILMVILFTACMFATTVGVSFRPNIDYDVEQTACGVIQSVYQQEFAKDLEEELK